MLSKTPRLLHLSIATLGHIHIYDLNISWKCRVHAGRWPFALREKYSSNVLIYIFSVLCATSTKHDCTSGRYLPPNTNNLTILLYDKNIVGYGNLMSNTLWRQGSVHSSTPKLFGWIDLFTCYVIAVKRIVIMSTRWNSKNEECKLIHYYTVIVSFKV